MTSSPKTSMIVSLAVIVVGAVATPAHADDTTPATPVDGAVTHADRAASGSPLDRPVALVVGGAVGVSGQTASLILFGPADVANLTSVQLHAGASLVHGWLEPGVDLTVAQATGLRALGAMFDVRAHLFPRWIVHPVLLAGVGLVDEHGTGMTDPVTGARLALQFGPGIEADIGRHWRVSLEATLSVVRATGEQQIFTSPNESAYYFAEGALITTNAMLGGTYVF